MLHTRNPFHIPFLSAAAISFIFGINLAYQISIDFIFAYIICFILLGLSFLFRKRESIDDFILIFLCFFIGVIHVVNFNTVGKDDIRYSPYSQAQVVLKGKAISPLKQDNFNQSLVCLVDEVSLRAPEGRSNLKTSGKVYVKISKYRDVDINYGDEVVLEGRLKELNAKGYFSRVLNRQGIKNVLLVKDSDSILKIKPAGMSFCGIALSLQKELRNKFKPLPLFLREFTAALVLGDRAQFPFKLYSLFKYTGTVHILAVSGFNIGIIILMLLLCLKAFRLKGIGRFIITAILLFLYALMTGFSASVVRAVIMGIAFLLSFLIRREYQAYNSLGLAALIILGIAPWQVYDIGFQLSFISVFSIVFLTPKISVLLPQAKQGFLNFIKLSFAVSFSAFIGTLPLTAYYFGMVSIVSLLANIIVLPLIPFLTIGGFVYLFFSYCNALLAKWAGLGLEFVFMLLILISRWLKDFPFAYFYVEKFSLYWVFVYYGVIMLVIFIMGIFLGKKQRQIS